MNITAWLAAAFLSLAGAAHAGTVGFQTVSIPVAGDTPLAAAIWYPAEAAERDMPLALYRQSVAPDAPVAGRGHGLIVISHGTSGSLADHYDTAHALAEAGFVVAAITHTGDTHSDRSRTMRVTERPNHLIALIDYMTGAWPGRDTVDAGRIGAFGFSSGGFTVLAAIGGEPDLNLIGPHCAEHPKVFTCALARDPAVGPMPARLAPVARDGRIRAAVIAAPALGFTFEPDGLKGVSAPVQLWRAGEDTVLPQPFYAEVVHRLLPRAEYHVVPGAEHYDFMAPCSDALAKAAPAICPKSIDRAAFHRAFNAEVVRFFERTLR